jgi:hypothetical protein
MSAMSALVRMRLTAYLRTQVAFAPLLAALVILGIFYGGGQAAPAEAYGMSAVVLFPVLAWQAKILFDVEPDLQRRIAATALGSRPREVWAGVAAAALTGVPTVVAGLVLPWLVGGVSMAKSPVSLPVALLLGVWVHVIAVPPAVALGALASRAVVRTTGNGVAMLVSGVVLAIVLGLKDSPAPWLMPPLMPASRELIAGLSMSRVSGITAWAVSWAAVVLFGYARLRRTRP